MISRADKVQAGWCACYGAASVTGYVVGTAIGAHLTGRPIYLSAGDYARDVMELAYNLTIGPFLLAVEFSHGFMTGWNYGVPPDWPHRRLIGYLLALCFWSSPLLLSRVRRLLGLRNPFGRLEAARPWSFRLVAFAGDWWNKTVAFGRHKTGGWGA